MKRVLITGLALAVTIFSSPIAIAGELDDIKKEMANIRADYEAKISALQAQVDSIARKELATSERVNNMNIGSDYVGRKNGAFGKGGLEFSSGTSTVTLGGYMDHEYEDFNESSSTFDQHRFVINIGAEIGERLRFYSEYEIEHGGPDVDGGEAKIEQAYVDYLINDVVNIRAGALLMPFGYTNLYHDSDLRDFTERPLVARDIIPSTWTDAGVGFFGEFIPTISGLEDLEISYEAYIVNGLDDGFSDTGLGGAKQDLSSDNNNDKSWVGRVKFSPAIGQHFAISGFHGDYAAQGDADINGIGFDSLLTYGAWELLTEYAYFNVDNTADEGSGGDIANDFTGLQVKLAYHFWPDFLNDTFMARSFDNPQLTAMARFGWANIDDDSDDATTQDNEERRWTLGMNYRPVESFVVKVEYMISDTEAEPLEKGNSDGVIASVAMGF